MEENLKKKKKGERDRNQIFKKSENRRYPTEKDGAVYVFCVGVLSGDKNGGPSKLNVKNPYMGPQRVIIKFKIFFK